MNHEDSKKDLPQGPFVAGEWIMRRIFHKKKHYNSSLSPTVRADAFFPRPAENTGISLSRRKSDTYPHFLDEHLFKSACGYNDPEYRAKCGVCAFQIEFAYSIELEVKPMPTEEDKGHVELPQITYDDFYQSNEQRHQEIMSLILKIIAEASDNLLIQPG